MLDPDFLAARRVAFPVFDAVDAIPAEPAWGGWMENSAAAVIAVSVVRGEDPSGPGRGDRAGRVSVVVRPDASYEETSDGLVLEGWWSPGQQRALISHAIAAFYRTAADERRTVIG
jgi:hypothetical protein